MKKMTFAVLAFSLCFTGIQTNAQQKKGKTVATKTQNDEGLNLGYRDTSVRPQDDFYNYVNGGWMKTAKIPSDKSTWGSFNQLREDTDNNAMNILKEILKSKYAPGTEGQKIQALYTTYTDWNKRNALGISPIKSDLDKVDAIKNLKDFQQYIDQATLTGDNPFYGWGAGADMKNSKMNAVYLGGPRLGLGKDFYQKENEANTKILAQYKTYITTLLGVIGYQNSAAVAQNLLDFEKKMAKTLLTNEQGRDANLRYNPKNVSELPALVKNVDLPDYLKTVGVNTDKVIIGEINYYKNLDSFINQENLPLIKDFLKYKIIASNASSLDQKLDEIQFNFYSKTLQGQQEQRPMDKRGLSFVNGIVGEAFGKLYVEKYFPAEAKAEMVVLVDYVKKAFANRIKGLEWMSPVTKEKALEKLNKFTVKVAYPDNWKDYSKLTLKSDADGGTLYDNLQAVSKWQYQKGLDKIGKPVDKNEWGMTPQTVNAYYSSSNNEIVFPAAILQPPFFNFKADAAVNFGGIGAVIGHEISHGFDDSGSRFDGDGNLNNWWTDQDRKKFEEATQKLAAQYDAYEPVKGSHVNGKFTMGENIGDLGGVNVAYDALQLYLKDKGNPGKISGLTQDQRFFMSWATVWRTLSTEQYKVNQVKTDPHSPGEYRAYGPLVNVDAFYKAFDIKPGDKHYKKPEDRIKIW
ncbi:endothelin-converting protein [Elizabethkingia meningoseptica]|uniref:M13 family metallopeptidase n=1 Tax=Elizabethkingia meningoseptica TaxID=238 RepID=UPI000332D3FC|nr:M13 family metallopeptidase [Elizabethkingia meningoseptica]AQX06440.1 endothelin-converting protein [Elizabethkingia meningoseptica]AQX48486.1 endothelin-converting protein [Elizabethkingia meningoseptica]EJK5327893.1 M13 family metallopeptidase [Elizabethkingia meningoseptica]EOR28731.1 metallopeptidase [Elizabethkingia meningoseptica ATCC 13253 = NBRC 12535]KUY16573.1 endothelin-converting protein [Elizabethkingia meningoseptica]